MNNHSICKSIVNKLTFMGVLIDGKEKSEIEFSLFLTLKLHKKSSYKFTIKYNGTQKGFITAFDLYTAAFDVEKCAEELLATRDTRTDGPKSLFEIINYAETVGEALVAINKELQDISDERIVRDIIKEVRVLHNDTPNGCIIDADTILADAIESADHRTNGLAEEVFSIWEKSANNDDQKLIERMFELFTDMNFSEYLEKCIKEITRKMHFFKVFFYTEDNNRICNEELYFKSAEMPDIEKIVEFCTAWSMSPFKNIINVIEIPEEEIEVITYHPEKIQVIE